MTSYQNYKRWPYYILFAGSFGFVWYLFKLGGVHKPVMAFYAASIDIIFSLISLLFTVEILLPKIFYRKYYFLSGLAFISIIAVTGS